MLSPKEATLAAIAKALEIGSLKLDEKAGDLGALVAKLELSTRDLRRLVDDVVKATTSIEQLPDFPGFGTATVTPAQSSPPTARPAQPAPVPHAPVVGEAGVVKTTRDPSVCWKCHRKMIRGSLGGWVCPGECGTTVPILS